MLSIFDTGRCGLCTNSSYIKKKRLQFHKHFRGMPADDIVYLAEDMKHFEKPRGESNHFRIRGEETGIGAIQTAAVEQRPTTRRTSKEDVVK